MYKRDARRSVLPKYTKSRFARARRCDVIRAAPHQSFPRYRPRYRPVTPAARRRDRARLNASSRKCARARRGRLPAQKCIRIRTTSFMMRMAAGDKSANESSRSARAKQSLFDFFSPRPSYLSYTRRFVYTTDGVSVGGRSVLSRATVSRIYNGG